jgi:cohesin complex subunit SCC1
VRSTFFLCFFLFLVPHEFSSLHSLLGPAGQSRHSIESIFSLGATNEVDGAAIDFDISTTEGTNDDFDASMTTTSKWHKNTIKVFDVLKKNLMPTPSNEEDDDEFAEGTKQRTVSYAALSEGVSRRTAAGFFFELLQLKTLNYIELDQSNSYGDIAISAGPKFLEEPPAQ